MSILLNRDLLSRCIQRKSLPSFLQKPNFSIPPFLLKSIKAELNVPVVIAAYRNEHGIMHYASYGLNLDTPFSKLAIASYRVCLDGAMVYPNIAICPEFAFYQGRHADDKARFYVGVPIRNAGGQVVGSLAILQEIDIVAKKGISLARMTQLGQNLANAASNMATELTSDVHDLGQQDRLFAVQQFDHDASLVA